jgi:hypothetical protein
MKNNCKTFSNILESLTPLGYECITLFSALIERKIVITNNSTINIESDSGIEYFALTHQDISPPHLYSDRFELGKWDYVDIAISSIGEYSLPFPYETNCYVYGIEMNTSLSKDDCIVNYYRRKEYESCGCNRKWLYYNSENMTDVRICPKNSKCNFDQKYDKKLMDKICRKNCYNEYHVRYTIGKFRMIGKLKKTFSFIYSSNLEVLITHSPKMVFIEYLSSIGGLMSMWFGISLFQLIRFVCEKMLNICKKYFQNISLTISISTRLSHFIKIFNLRNMNFIIILVYGSIMLCQLTDMINSYFKYEVITRVQSLHTKLNPKVTIGYAPLYINIDKLYLIYPEFKKENELLVEDSLKRRNMWKYFEKLIAELRFEELQQINNAKNFIKSCKLSRNSQTIDCSNSRNGLQILGNDYPAFIFNPIFNNNSKSLYEDNICNDQNMDGIELTLNAPGIAFIYLGDCKSVHTGSELFMIDTNTISQIGFTSYSLEKSVETLKYGCVKNEKYSYENCYQNCYFFNCNQTYGCVQSFYFLLYMDFEMHFISNGYKICNHSIKETDEMLFWNKCNKLCPLRCRSLSFRTKFIASEHQKSLNETILRIFAIKSPHFEYIETLNMNINQLIYNCGGILGLWFGLSPLSIDDLVQILKLIQIRLKLRIIGIKNFIFHLIFKFKRLILLLYRIFRNLNINLRLNIEIEY